MLTFNYFIEQHHSAMHVFLIEIIDTNMEIYATKMR